MQRFREKAHEMTNEVPALEERKKAIESLNEECYRELGKFLAPDILDHLGDWLLHESHTNTDAYKVAREEYPVLSKYQIKRRMRKSVLMADEDSLSTLAYHIKNNSTFRNKDRREGWCDSNA